MKSPRRSGLALVGDVARGEFVCVPAIAVTVIEVLGAGGTLAEVARRVRAETGTQVDVVDFAATLVELGFVARLDGAPLTSMSPEMIKGGRLGAAAARLARPIYSRAAFALYGLLFVGCIVSLTAASSLRPHVTQLFFLSNPVLSVRTSTRCWPPASAA